MFPGIYPDVLPWVLAREVTALLKKKKNYNKSDDPGNMIP